MALKNSDYSSYTLQSSVDCLYLIEDLAPHALLVDINTLISEERREFISEIKDHEKLSKIPLIMTGTRDDFEDINEGSHPFDGFIERPQSPALMVKEIKKIIE